MQALQGLLCLLLHQSAPEDFLSQKPACILQMEHSSHEVASWAQHTSHQTCCDWRRSRMDTPSAPHQLMKSHFSCSAQRAELGTSLARQVCSAPVPLGL